MRQINLLVGCVCGLLGCVAPLDGLEAGQKAADFDSNPALQLFELKIMEIISVEKINGSQRESFALQDQAKTLADLGRSATLECISGARLTGRAPEDGSYITPTRSHVIPTWRSEERVVFVDNGNRDVCRLQAQNVDQLKNGEHIFKARCARNPDGYYGFGRWFTSATELEYTLKVNLERDTQCTNLSRIVAARSRLHLGNNESYEMPVRIAVARPNEPTTGALDLHRTTMGDEPSEPLLPNTELDFFEVRPGQPVALVPGTYIFYTRTDYDDPSGTHYVFEAARALEVESGHQYLPVTDHQLPSKWSDGLSYEWHWSLGEEIRAGFLVGEVTSPRRLE